MDPRSMMKGAWSRVEFTIIGVVNKTMANPAMTRLAVKAMEATLPLKVAVEKNLRFLYRSMNLPSRDDLDILAAKVRKLSEKQEVLDAKIEMLGKRIDKNE
jgi:hypothetical protein